MADPLNGAYMRTVYGLGYEDARWKPLDPASRVYTGTMITTRSVVLFRS